MPVLSPKTACFAPAGLLIETSEVLTEPYEPPEGRKRWTSQLIAEKRRPLPAKPEQPERFDYECKRNGTRNLFVFSQPLAGWRHVLITEHRTKIDYASQGWGWPRRKSNLGLMKLSSSVNVRHA